MTALLEDYSWLSQTGSGCSPAFTEGTPSGLPHPSRKSRSQATTEPPGGTPAILLLDIETGPNLAYVWNMYDGNIYYKNLVSPQELLCFSAQWLDGETMFFSRYHHTYKGMLDAVWKLLDEADILITYYGKKHDVPHINRELAQSDMPPPSPYKHIDLCNVMKSQFKFPYNKLDYVLEAFGFEGKAGSIGMENWIGCLKDKPESWEAMKIYSLRDTAALQELYYKVRPWINQHPNLAIYRGERCCPACGSGKLQSRGYAYTSVSKFQRFQCQEKGCGKWSRRTLRDDTIRITEVAG